MGFDLTRFVSNINPELICAICQGVYDNPKWSPECQHIFCAECIGKWLEEHNNCPIDRNVLQMTQIESAPRFFKSFVDELEIKCNFANCDQVVSLAQLRSHIQECDCNPDKIISCPICKVETKQVDMDDHNCLQIMQNLIVRQERKITDMNKEVCNLKKIVEELQGFVMSMVQHKQPLKRSFREPSNSQEIEIGHQPKRRLNLDPVVVLDRLSSVPQQPRGFGYYSTIESPLRSPQDRPRSSPPPPPRRTSITSSDDIMRRFVFQNTYETEQNIWDPSGH